MKIVTTTCVFSPSVSDEDAFKKLASLGYEGIDFDFTVENGSLYRDDFESHFRMLRLLADKLKITCRHGHAPGNLASHGEIMKRCFVAAEILGIKYLAVHPVNLNDEGKFLEDKEEFIRKNTLAVEPLLDLAQNHGIYVMMENLPWSTAKDPRFCSDFVKSINHPLFGWCYDTGHANIVGFKPETLAELVPPLSLHLHDNHHDVWNDEHLMPGDGDLDFAKLWDALLRAGYRGDYVLEAHHQARAAQTDEQRDEILAELLRRSRIVRNALDANGHITQ